MRTQTTPRTRPTRTERASTPHGRPARRITLAVAVDDYLMARRSEGLSAKTIEWHTTALGLLLRLLEQDGIEDPRELETTRLRHWVVWLGTPESVAGSS